MQRVLSVLDRSVTIKLVLIGLLVLILLIPTLMIHGVVSDRAELAQQARADIARSWGQPQQLSGPFLLIPWQRDVVTDDGKTRRVTGVLAHLPKRADTRIAVDTQLRYRGLYTVPVYGATAQLQADFVPPDLAALGLVPENLQLHRARLAIALSDLRTLRSAPVFESGGHTVELAAGAYQDTMGLAMIDAPADALQLDVLKASFSVQTELKFAGSNRLSVVPVGDSQHVAVNANWPDPSFTGRYLPRERTISSDGFDALWDITSLGRGFGVTTVDAARLTEPMRMSAFGVNLKPGLSTYDKARRALRYAILAITLTFACFFLFDVLGALRLHAVQYLLVGFANCLFFLLLISLAEHIGFAGGYAISAAASALLIGGYSAVVLQARWRAALCTGALAATYGFIYMTLGAQTYALLVGSLGLWFVLAAVMYLTRHVDWRTASSDARSAHSVSQ